MTATGLLGGLACKPCYLLISQYFDRNRGKANAILMAGICTGQFVGPPLVRYLLDEYSLMGATLIVGAIVLHSCVGAALFQPVQWHMKKPLSVSQVLLPHRADDKSMNTIKDTDSKGYKKKCPETEQEDIEFENKMLRRLRNRRISESSSMSLGVSCIDLASVPLNNFNKTEMEDDADKDDSVASQFSRVHEVMVTTVRVMKSIISDLTILKSPRALIIAIGGVCSINGYLNLLLITPFAIQDAGYSLEDAAWCMSAAAVTNLVARLVTSSLSDFRWFNMRLIYMIGVTVIAGSTVGRLFMEYLT